MTRPYLITLTPLRGMAALMVVVFHFNMLVLPVVDPAITQLHRRWYLLVDFFFILSGFIMVYVYGSWFGNQVSIRSWRQYMAARFARVYPLHLFTLLWLIGVYVLLTRVYHVALDAVARRVFEVTAIPLHVLMLQGFNTVRSSTWNVSAWSLGSEWLLYLVFPGLMFAFRKLSLAGKLVLVAVVAGLYFFLTQPLQTGKPYNSWLWPLQDTLDDITFPMSFLRCFAGFALGMLTYHAYEQQWGRAWLGRSWFFAAAGMGLLASGHWQLHDAVTIGVFPLLILGACYNTGRVSKVLQTRPLQRLGDWSYSIYMVHIPVLFSFLAVQLIHAPAPSRSVKAPVYGLVGPVVCLFFIGIVLLISALAYRFVEVPARTYLKSRLNKPRVDPKPALSQPLKAPN